MTDEGEHYVLCADDDSLAKAIIAIKSSSIIMLDREGVDLGVPGGALSLISLRTPGNPTTYLVDAVTLSNNKLRPLFDIIQSTSPPKIVFDGRMDFSELYHSYSVRMDGVLDVQLADVHSRRQRGEDEDDQLQRLSPYLYRREVFGQHTSYAAVHRLCGLDQCVREHKLIADDDSRRTMSEFTPIAPNTSDSDYILQSTTLLG